MWYPNSSSVRLVRRKTKKEPRAARSPSSFARSGFHPTRFRMGVPEKQQNQLEVPLFPMEIHPSYEDYWD